MTAVDCTIRHQIICGTKPRREQFRIVPPGFYLIVLTLSDLGGGVFLTLIYWSLLRTKCQHPRTAANMGQAWAFVGTKAAPLLRFIPGSGKIIELIKPYFRP